MEQLSCQACGKSIVKRPYGAVGYAIRLSDNARICYACAANETLALAQVTGEIFAYVRCQEGRPVAITTWDGTRIGKVLRIGAPYRSNFGDCRRWIWFSLTGRDQELWSGVYYDDAGGYIIAHRRKGQSCCMAS